MKRGTRGIEERRVLQHIGQQIQSARKGRNFSQSDLAERLKKSQQMISGYEKGTKAIPVAELPLLAEALGVPIAFFFEAVTYEQYGLSQLALLAPIFRECALVAIVRYRVIQEWAFRYARSLTGKDKVVLDITVEPPHAFRTLEHMDEECVEGRLRVTHFYIEVDPENPINPLKPYQCDNESFEEATDQSSEQGV
jgi:transcriptional regulator with XRE-family HTH domain